MMRPLPSPVIVALVVSIVAAPAIAQQAQPSQNLDPDNCGAAGRGCASDLEKKYMALAYKLAPDLPSYLVAQFASACAKQLSLRAECERDSKAVLLKLGFPKEDME